MTMSGFICIQIKSCGWHLIFVCVHWTRPGSLMFCLLKIQILWYQIQKYFLTHWGRVTHIYVNKIIIIGSDNGLSPSRRQAIIWPVAGILLIGPLEINFSDILIEINTFSFRNCIWKCRMQNGVYFVSTSMCFNRASVPVISIKFHLFYICDVISNSKLEKRSYVHSALYLMIMN